MVAPSISSVDKLRFAFLYSHVSCVKKIVALNYILSQGNVQIHSTKDSNKWLKDNKNSQLTDQLIVRF